MEGATTAGGILKAAVAKRFLTAEEFAELFNVSLQRAYDVLRRNPEITVRLGLRQIRVDSAKLEDWVKKGGARNAA
jgi:plasmid maintenance system antidote protein VapI